MKRGRPVREVKMYRVPALRAVRLARNISARELALLIGVTESSILAWEKGRSRVSNERVVALSKALNVPAQRLRRPERMCTGKSGEEK